MWSGGWGHSSIVVHTHTDRPVIFGPPKYPNPRNENFNFSHKIFVPPWNICTPLWMRTHGHLSWFYGNYKDVWRRSRLLESCPYHEARFESKALVPRVKSPATLAAVMAVYSIAVGRALVGLSRKIWTPPKWSPLVLIFRNKWTPSEIFGPP